METYNRSEELLGTLKQAFNNPKYCDVAVVDAEGAATHCMRWVLQSKSKVFDRMLDTEMVEGLTNEIHIKDVDPVHLLDVLKSLHTGIYRIAAWNFIPMRYLGDLYDITELRECCMKFETTGLVLDAHSCCQLLNDAMVHCMEDITEKCLEYIVNEMDAVCDLPEFKALSYSAMLRVHQHAATTLFSDKDASADVCAFYIVGMVKWIESSIDFRKQFLVHFFEDVDLSKLRVNHIAHLCSYECVQNCSKLWGRIIKTLGNKEKHGLVKNEGRHIDPSPQGQSSPWFAFCEYPPHSVQVPEQNFHFPTYPTLFHPFPVNANQ